MENIAIEKLKDILSEHNNRVLNFKDDELKLISKIDFFTTHNFNEEKRIALIKQEESSKILYRYNCIVNEIRDYINDLEA